MVAMEGWREAACPRREIAHASHAVSLAMSQRLEVRVRLFLAPSRRPCSLSPAAAAADAPKAAEAASAAVVVVAAAAQAPAVAPADALISLASPPDARSG